jgi:phospholipid/cholesterol/gamma-HCH transport system substrate-binding protein
MSIDPVLVRRIMGTASVVLLIALSTVVLDSRFAPPAGSYEVTADLGRAGSGLRAGNDVKVRGVNVGEVSEVFYENGRARAVMTMQAEPRLPEADEIELVVTAKTLLGEKQIELSFDEDRFGAEPFLEAGDVVVADREPTELTEAIDALVPFVEAIDPHDLATIVDTLGAQKGEGERIAENIELSQEMFEFGSRTADDSLDRLRSFADIAEALAPATDDLARMNRTLPEATALLTERQAEIRSNLDTVSRAANTLTAFLETEGNTISRFLRTSQPVGDVIERQAPEVGNLVNGLSLYVRSLGMGGMLLDDGSEWAGFRIFLILEDDEGFDLEGGICDAFGDQLPACEEAA